MLVSPDPHLISVTGCDIGYFIYNHSLSHQHKRWAMSLKVLSRAVSYPLVSPVRILHSGCIMIFSNRIEWISLVILVFSETSKCVSLRMPQYCLECSTYYVVALSLLVLRGYLYCTLRSLHLYLLTLLTSVSDYRSGSKNNLMTLMFKDGMLPIYMPWFDILLFCCRHGLLRMYLG